MTTQNKTLDPKLAALFARLGRCLDTIENWAIDTDPETPAAIALRDLLRTSYGPSWGTIIRVANRNDLAEPLTASIRLLKRTARQRLTT